MPNTPWIAALIMTSLLAAAPRAKCAISTATERPSAEHNLHFTTPSVTWDEALPLGNGIMGALVWGGATPEPDNALKISLDRTDLWDLRPIPEFQSKEYSYSQMRRWREEGKAGDIARIYDVPYLERPAPTKISAGRLRLSFPNAPAFAESTLDIDNAVALVKLTDGTQVRVFTSAQQPVGLVQVTSTQVPQLQLVAPLFRGQAQGREVNNGDYGDLVSLGYPAPVETSGNNWRAFTQEGFGGFSFAVYVAWQKRGAQWEAAWSVASSLEGEGVLERARTRVDTALHEGWKKSLVSHRAWWREYWNQSSITLPNKVLERQWYLDQYKFGAASRRGAPPVTLQGPWTADDGKLPPWKGDYHHDLNTQLSYWPCYSANHLQEGLSYLDWLWKIRPNSLAWAKRFWKMPGLNVPGVSDFNGNAMGGWPQYSFSSTTACWLAQHFYLHWRYSRDEVFLRERAYPYLKDAATFIEAITAEKDESGKRTLPLSSSPEIGDNRLEAWFPTITNYDLALMRSLLAQTAELATELKLSNEANHWKKVLSELPDFAFGEDGRLLIAKDHSLTESHRHFSHLMALHPLGLIDWDDGEAARRTIRANLLELGKHGPGWWTGFSYAWLANLQARARDGAGAERTLEIFSTAFTLRNSFHVNGDQTGKGYSKYDYRPFTLEGNFAAAAAIQEMLLQSQTGVLRIFPAVPESWRDVSFFTLRAEGTFLVSAQRRNGATVRVEITAEKGGVCRLASPFSGRVLDLQLERGEHRVLTRDP